MAAVRESRSEARRRDTVPGDWSCLDKGWLSPSHPHTLAPSRSPTLTPSHPLALPRSHPLALSPSHSLTFAPSNPLSLAVRGERESQEYASLSLSLTLKGLVTCCLSTA